MPRLRNVYIFPYSGWPNVPWSDGKEAVTPYCHVSSPDRYAVESLT
jgi:hypothetical protein